MTLLLLLVELIASAEWKWGGRGRTCDQTCSSSSPCNLAGAERMDLITSFQSFKVRLLADGFTSKAEELNPVYAAYPRYRSDWGSCAPYIETESNYGNNYYRSGPGATCACDPSGSKDVRLCCCVAPGERARTACPVSGSDCTATPGYKRDYTSKKCIETYPSGYCTLGSWIDDANSKCSLCPLGKYGTLANAQSEAAACGGTCSIGQFASYAGSNSAACGIDCPAFGSATPPGSAICSNIESGWIVSTLSQSCDQACAGDVSVTGRTSTCQESRIDAVSSQAKLELVNGAVKHARGIDAGLTCPNGFDSISLTASTFGTSCPFEAEMNALSYQGKCVYTPTAAGTCSSSTTSYKRLCCCTAAGEDPITMCPTSPADCTENGMLSSAGTCVQPASGCPTGRYADSTNACIACVSGRFGNRTGETSSAACDGLCSPGRFSALPGLALNEQCDRCEAGKFGSASPGKTSSADACNGECSLGRWSNQTGLIADSQCFPCDVGTFMSSTVAGSSGPVSTACVGRCSAGKHADGKDALSSDAQCTDCDAGRFSNAMGLQTGAQCAGTCTAGRSSNVPGQVSDVTCVQCGVHSVATAGKSVCIDCGPRYSPSTLNATCKLNPGFCGMGTVVGADERCFNCLAGRFSGNVSAATVCSECGLGYFARNPGQSSCDACPIDTVTGIAYTASVCSPCALGAIRDEARISCLPCGVGHHKALAVVKGVSKMTCAPCSLGFVALAGAMNCTACELSTGEFANEARAGCTRCAANTYHALANDSTCTSCPKRGVLCENSKILIEAGYWLQLKASHDSSLAVIDSTSTLYRCLNSEACVEPKSGDHTVICDASLGYQGIICGDCSMSRGFVRSGNGCSKCLHLALSISLSIGMYFVWKISMIYYVAFMAFDAGDRNDTTGVTFKLLMSFNQMLSILGIFKARGTAVFRRITNWPASIVGGGLTTVLFVKCTLHSPLYGPFGLTMLTPVAAFLLTCLILIPKTWWERKQELARQLEGEALPPPPTQARWMPLPAVGGRVERFVSEKVTCWPQVELDELQIVEWRAIKVVERQTTFSPMRRLASVTVFVLFSLYPTLIQSSVSVLRCSDPIAGKRYLVEDYEKVCYTPTHIFVVGIGSFGLFIYAFGIPMGAFILLWRSRKMIAANDPRATGSLGFLFAGYSTTRGGIVMSWEVLVMLRKLCIVVLGIVELSGTIQVLCAILLLVFALLLTINVRPYATLWLNLLEEGSLVALVLTQTLSLAYLDLDTSTTTAEERALTTHRAKEIAITVLLFAINIIIFVALVTSFVTSALRYYGPKAGCCRPDQWCARAIACICDEKWEKRISVSHAVELVWRDAVGAVTKEPAGLVAKWILAPGSTPDAAVAEKILLTHEGRATAPPLGHELAFLDDNGAPFDLGNTTPAWRDVQTAEYVELTDSMRSQVEWRNSRTGAISLVDPNGGSRNGLVPALDDGGAAGRAAAANAGVVVAGNAAAVGPAAVGAAAVGAAATGAAVVRGVAAAGDGTAVGIAAVAGGAAVAGSAAALASRSLAASQVVHTQVQPGRITGLPAAAASARHRHQHHGQENPLNDVTVEMSTFSGAPPTRTSRPTRRVIPL